MPEQLILAVHHGPHDAGAAVLVDYEVKAAVQLERLTRVKGDGSYPHLSIEEALGIVGATLRDVDVLAISRSDFPVQYFLHFRRWRWLREQWRTHVEGKKLRSMTRETRRANTPHAEDFFDVASMRRDHGLRDDAVVHFYNHHLAHALPAVFYTEWGNALLVTSDGGGDTVNHSHRHFDNGEIKTIYGGDECLTLPPPIDSLGHAYGAATRALGFRANRHEGKVTGLSAMGKPIYAERIAKRFHVDQAGRVHSNFRNVDAMFDLLRDIASNGRREDVAASIQKVLEDTMLVSVRRLLRQNPARHLGVAGGVFSNVRLNRVLAEQLDIDEIFVFPPMGDDGLPVGGALSYLLKRDGLKRWLSQRRRLSDVYLGRDYSKESDDVLTAIDGVRRVPGDPIQAAAKCLARGEIGAIYTGRMEYGPRALGARSILANPCLRETHDLLNERLSRTEFMPFAPVVPEERAAEVFDVNSVNAYACRFMTITCDVRPAWRERIAAVVHVDGSARPQTIRRDANPLYYDVVSAFGRTTGIPVLVNTSFNVHEEPIVNTPNECAKALVDRRIDFVVTQRAIYEAAAPRDNSQAGFARVCPVAVHGLAR
ncbi:MAG TPA: carbamoyltransferase C-terminal domain-containing protein [Xanthobacteraceae bacterium]|nr:carbamoyltransferase C-terminal domain-containing protein [Xanthobacteraceae bacterium]